MNSFIQQTDGSFIRYFDINGIYFLMIIPEVVWNEYKESIYNSVSYWKREMLNGKSPEFKWGDIKVIDSIPTDFVCNLCGKSYTSQRSFRYHRNTCSQLDKKKSSLQEIKEEIQEELREELREELKEEIREELKEEIREELKEQIKGEIKEELIEEFKEDIKKEETRIPSNIRHESPGDTFSHLQESSVNNQKYTNSYNTNTDNSTHTDNSIHINIRSFGSENPNWLTAELIASVLNDPPSAHERLIRKKHFNEQFPENSNLRIDTKRGVDKRIQVYEDTWRIRDTLTILKLVIFHIHDILDDFINRDAEDIYDDVAPSSSSSDKEDSYQHLQKELRKFNDNEYFVRKRERIRHIWEEIEREVESGTKESRLLDIIKTLLLDKHLQEDTKKGV